MSKSFSILVFLFFIQLLEEVTGPIPVKEPNIEEAEWIYDQCFGFPFKILPSDCEIIISKAREEVRQEVASELDIRDKELIQRKVAERIRKIFVPEIEFVLTQLHDYKLEVDNAINTDSVLCYM